MYITEVYIDRKGPYKNNKVEITLNIPQYNSDKGLESHWEVGFDLSTKIVGNEIVITGNKAGLISLAIQMLALAQDEVPSGSHYHYDEYNSLKQGSNELVIEKDS